MQDQAKYHILKTKLNYIPNLWDIVVLLIVATIFAVLAWGASQMAVPYQVGEHLSISLDPLMLPNYGLRTVLRMFFALILSFLFTFLIAPLAAKNKKAGSLIIPAIDILQSIPVLGMLSITVVAFIQLFPGSLLGAECAAIFAIFTSQVWNMTFGFYQSMLVVPKEYYEAGLVFHLNPWQRFWRIDVPFALPSLLWNTMASMSAGWFFVVASEAISVSNQNILLPGIGSYIKVAIDKADLNAIFYAIAAMFIIILLYDQLFFRPLLAWMERFTLERHDEEVRKKSWFYQFLAKRFWYLGCLALIDKAKSLFLQMSFLPKPALFKLKKTFSPHSKMNRLAEGFWNLALVFGVIFALTYLANFIIQTVSLHEIKRVFMLGGITAVKISILIVLASILWIPIGVGIGMNPKLRNIFQPASQIIAAFPVNLIYPIIVTLIVKYNLNVDIWSSPLMILGTQWYILFNVIAGATNLPQELTLTAKNLGIKNWLWWKKFILPGIFPYYITGATTAAAGCWNASIVADTLNWGNHQLTAVGIGSYISQYTTAGDFPRIALGISVMSIYVILFNRLVWHKLYQLAAKRFVLEV